MAPPSHPRILSVGRALPRHRVDQETITAALSAAWAREHFNAGRLADIHRATTVSGRHLALPLDAYAGLDGLGARNDAWLEAALDVGERAVRDGLSRAGLAPADVGHVLFVSTTGLATPSVDARLANRLGLPSSVRRTPIFGLGCLGGAAGLARAADALRAHPDDVAVMLSVELCSLTLQREDLSVANVVATGLFGDGAAAVVMAGGARAGLAGPRVVATRSVLYPDTERVMGWDVVDRGFKVVLSAKVPELVEANVGADADAFLGERGLARGAVRHWIAHTGGPKVLEAFRRGLGLPAAAVAGAVASLREVGNLSSASVLFVLGELLDSGAPRGGDLGVLVAMGPGFASEWVLLAW